MFGEFIKQKRIENRLSLREFCRILEEDASNWSKVERGILLPPHEEKKLKKIAKILKIDLKSEKWKELQDLASVDAGKIPNYVMSNEEVVRLLPVFFRTVGSVKPTSEELKKLVQNIKDGT